jgi:DNA-binding NarL/FixJ family response regulator
MADGRSNREIAEALVIAPATVASHVRSILTKTNTSNRAAAGSWAARQGLTDEAAGE